jgi:hypothetical protein
MIYDTLFEALPDDFCLDVFGIIQDYVGSLTLDGRPKKTRIPIPTDSASVMSLAMSQDGRIVVLAGDWHGTGQRLLFYVPGQLSPCFESPLLNLPFYARDMRTVGDHEYILRAGAHFFCVTDKGDNLWQLHAIRQHVMSWGISLYPDLDRLVFRFVEKETGRDVVFDRPLTEVERVKYIDITHENTTLYRDWVAPLHFPPEAISRSENGVYLTAQNKLLVTSEKETRTRNLPSQARNSIERFGGPDYAFFQHARGGNYLARVYNIRTFEEVVPVPLKLGRKLIDAVHPNLPIFYTFDDQDDEAFLALDFTA